MTALRIIGASVAAICSFFAGVLAFGFVGWGWSDSGGHWSIVQWMLTVIPFSLPFLFCCWIVHRCLWSKWTYTILAEVLAIVAALFWLKRTGSI